MKRKQHALLQCKQKFERIVVTPIPFPVVSVQQRKENEQFIEMLKQQDKSKMLESLQQNNPIFDLSWMKAEEQEQFQALSEQFVKEAKAFDSTLTDDDIFQALRNIWIIWMVELLFDKPLTYHSAMFGYSMLYPYSDNLLDDVHIVRYEKKAFNDWFSKRLHGEQVTCDCHVKEAIDRLVTMIEKQYDRGDHPSVYEGLYMIQDAQIASLQQRDITEYQRIYDISVEKGGTSVIADGYLIDGALSDIEYQFCVDFGFALQIVDDIQDQQEDRENNHHTLATLCQTPEERETLFYQCWILFDHIIDQFPCHRENIKDFVKDSCHQLLAECVLKQKQSYPSHLVEHIQQAMPIEETYASNAMEDMKERMKTLQIENSTI